MSDEATGEPVEAPPPHFPAPAGPEQPPAGPAATATAPDEPAAADTEAAEAAEPAEAEAAVVEASGVALFGTEDAEPSDSEPSDLQPSDFGPESPLSESVGRGGREAVGGGSVLPPEEPEEPEESFGVVEAEQAPDGSSDPSAAGLREPQWSEPGVSEGAALSRRGGAPGATAGSGAGRPGTAVVEPTGDERVDAALGRLGELDGAPVSEHVGVFEEIHQRLQDLLASADQEGQGPPVPRPPMPGPRS